jgi:excisionase family DNA binding protein
MHQHESRLAVGMAEAALRLGLSARTIANLIKRKELSSRKVGRRRIIPIAALEAFVTGDSMPGRTGSVEAVRGDKERAG